MKRKLFLLRHSYAEPPGSAKDEDRVLTTEGASTARALGRKLTADRFNPQKIISSTAARAVDTTLNLAEELGMSEQMIEQNEKVYNASVRELLEVVNAMDDSIKSALIVGHNPSVSYFGELVTAVEIGSVEPCGLVAITFDGLKWKEVSQASGTFVSYYHPNH